MKKLARRRILEERGLLYAPRDHQGAFWLCYNRSRRPTSARVGELAEQAISEASLASARRLRELDGAWQAVAPKGTASLSRVETFARGCLTVTVDSAATKYVLSCQTATVLLDALNDHVTGPNVKRIRFRIGHIESDVGG